MVYDCIVYGMVGLEEQMEQELQEAAARARAEAQAPNACLKAVLQ